MQTSPAAITVAIHEKATLKGEWKAMGPLSRFMTVLGLIGFIVGIPGWVTKEYWLGKNSAPFIIPPAIAEQLRPDQVALLSDALKSLEARAGETGTPEDQVVQALQAAERGNLKLAEGLLEEVYRSSAGKVAGAQASQALAARHLAALAIVGDSAKALALYKQSTELEPANRDGWLGLGDAALSAGTLDEAANAFSRFLALAPAETAPLEHAAGQDRLGDVLLAKGDVEGARAAYGAAIKLTQKLLETDKSNANLQRNIAVSIKKLGDVDETIGNYKAALASYQDGITLMRGIVEKTQGQTGARDLSVFLNRAGDMELRLGNGDAALKAYNDSLGVIDQLSKANPDDMELRRDVSVSYMSIGNFKAAAKASAEALGAFTQAFAIREEMVRRDPANSEWQRDLAVALLRAGDMKVATGDATGASGNYEQALAIIRRLSSQDPANTELRRDLSVALTAKGDGSAASGNTGDAVSAYAESRSILEALVVSQPDKADLKRDRIVLGVKMAEAGIDAAQNLQAALTQAQTMQAEGTLSEGDAWMIEDLKARLQKLQPQG